MQRQPWVSLSSIRHACCEISAGSGHQMSTCSGHLLAGDLEEKHQGGDLTRRRKFPRKKANGKQHVVSVARPEGLSKLRVLPSGWRERDTRQGLAGGWRARECPPANPAVVRAGPPGGCAWGRGTRGTELSGPLRAGVSCLYSEISDHTVGGCQGVCDRKQGPCWRPGCSGPRPPVTSPLGSL